MKSYILKNKFRSDEHTLVYWKFNDFGYTEDLEEARVFSEKEIESMKNHAFDHKFEVIEVHGNG
jgi:hypothetical protein